MSGKLERETLFPSKEIAFAIEFENAIFEKAGYFFEVSAASEAGRYLFYARFLLPFPGV